MTSQPHPPHQSSEQARRVAEAPVPWDEVRQRRVLGRIEAALPVRAESRRARRRLAIAGAGVAAAVAAALLLWLPAAAVEEPIALPSPSVDAIAAAPMPATPSIPYATWPQLRLPDDSRAELRHGARVDVEIQQADLVRLTQHDGEVRYEVTPDRQRAFVVDAAGIEVRVVGTIFTVSVEDEARRVAVSVERGLVEVDNGTRVAELGPGDELRLDVVDTIDLLDEPAADTEDDAGETEAEPTPSRSGPRPPSPGPSLDALQADADAARASGDLSRAAAALGELVRRYPKDPRAYSAYFQLGKVERARGRHAAAAKAFVRCWKRSPAGALAEDARAEAAASWRAAGELARAREAAQGYLQRYGSGAHRARMQQLLDELP